MLDPKSSLQPDPKLNPKPNLKPKPKHKPKLNSTLERYKIGNYCSYLNR